MANITRGEVEIVLGQTHYVLIPDFKAICSIEAELDKGVIELIQKCQMMTLKFSEASVILKHAMSAAGNDMELKEIGDLIINEGLDKLVTSLLLYLGFYLVGPESKEKNPPGQPGQLTALTGDPT